MSQEEMKQLWSTAWQQYKRSESDATTLREKFLETRAQIAEEKGDIDTAQKIRSIGQRGRLKECYQAVRQALKPQGNSGILHIEIPNPSNNKEIIKIMDPEKMQQIMSENVKGKFTEAYDTPIANVLFTSIIGIDGLTHDAERILQGNYVFPPVIHLDIVEFFEHIKAADEIMHNKPVQTTTTPINFTSFWKKGRENISFSMSRMHNGHYIAATISP